MPDTLPLSRATTLIPFLEFLDELGAPVDRALAQEHLPLRLREKPGCYVATKLNWGFVGRMARQEGLEDLGLRVGHQAGVSILGRALYDRLVGSPTLAHALQTFCEHAAKESTGMTCWVTTNEGQVEVHLRKTFGPTTPGYRDTEWLGLLAIVTVVQLFLGPTWEPTSISLRAVGPVPKLAHGLFPETTFVTGQPRVFVAFPREALNQSPTLAPGSPRFEQPRAWGSELFDEAPAEGLFGALAQSLEPYLADGYPDVTLGARIADMSVRTLQRRLSLLGVSYSTVVDEARFRIASKMLAATDAPSIEIAKAVGYSDPSHFARAFRRLTGLSPRDYRSQAGRVEAE
jgi:AraC-like DNA-binding protein